MKKSARFQIFIFLFLLTQYSFSQVDVVYNDLVWSDEFEVNGPANTNKWFHETLLPDGGTSWFNGELQHYTDRITNSFVSNGLLNIVAKKENYTDQGVTKEYTSARMTTKFAFKYGRVDVRAKVPIEAGSWPAIWMLGKNQKGNGTYFGPEFGTVGWPACGEIDIMEHGIFPSKPTDYIQGTLHTPSSYGSSVNNGGTTASNLQNEFHVYSMNWSPYQISFLLDGEVFYTYNPEDKNDNTWPFDKEQFLLLDVAMGGIAGNVPGNFNQATMQIDYVRVYQNTTVDTKSPTNFTGAVGEVKSSSVELLLNGTDDSGTILYTINYGDKTISVAGASGIQKSVVIPNLAPNTDYTFTVTATDMSGNAAANNPIVLTATTLAPSDCFGSDNQAQQGTFSVGYNYTFETIGTDVKITFEMLDKNKIGLVAFLWNQTPFTESQMTNVSGTVFTKTITGQTIGSTINYAVKFAFANGLAVTKYFSYRVGNNCTLGTERVSELFQFCFQNPAHDYLYITSEAAIDKVEIYNMVGAKVISISEDTNKVAVSMLPKGVYLLTVYSGTQKSVKKMVVK